MSTARWRSIAWAAAALVAVGAGVEGCASGGQAFPMHPSDAPAAINRASALISDAAAAGADSLAPELMKSARLHYEDAQTERHGNHRDRAPMTAKLAAADAIYAKALAQCMLADRALAAEQAQLAGVPVASPAKPQNP